MIRVAVSPEGEGWVVEVRPRESSTSHARTLRDTLAPRWEVVVLDGAEHERETRVFRREAAAITWARSRAVAIERGVNSS